MTQMNFCIENDTNIQINKYLSPKMLNNTNTDTFFSGTNYFLHLYQYFFSTKFFPHWFHSDTLPACQCRYMTHASEQNIHLVHSNVESSFLSFELALNFTFRINSTFPTEILFLSPVKKKQFCFTYFNQRFYHFMQVQKYHTFYLLIIYQIREFIL